MGKILVIKGADFSSVSVEKDVVYVETTETNLVWDSGNSRVGTMTGYAGIYFPCSAGVKYNISGGAVLSCVTTSVTPVENTPVTNIKGASQWPNDGMEYTALTDGYVLVSSQVSSISNLVVSTEV